MVIDGWYIETVLILCNIIIMCIASDINECEENTHGCAHTCTDTTSSYTCSCRSGYRLGSDRHRCYGKYKVIFPIQK